MEAERTNGETLIWVQSLKGYGQATLKSAKSFMHFDGDYRQLKSWKERFLMEHKKIKQDIQTDRESGGVFPKQSSRSRWGEERWSDHGIIGERWRFCCDWTVVGSDQKTRVTTPSDHPPPVNPINNEHFLWQFTIYVIIVSSSLLIKRILVWRHQGPVLSMIACIGCCYHHYTYYQRQVVVPGLNN